MPFGRVSVSLGRRLFIKRRFTVGVVVASVPFLGYLLLFASSDSGRSISVPEETLSTNISCDCPCATKQQTQNKTVKLQTEAVVTSTASAFTRERKVEHDSSESTGSLNVHMWSEICGTNVDILRNWPHFPYFPDKRSFISKFHKTQVLNMRNNGERIFGFVHPQRSGEYKFAITSDDTSELWLSPNEDPASSEMIARVYSPDGSAWTEEGDYKKYPDQISKEIILNAGKKYYIESLSKQGSGAAHVAVYWSHRNSTFEIISTKYLSNFSENNNHESIPPHAGKKANIMLRRKSKQYYFNRLPVINRKEYISLFPACSYSPSFLVHGKIQRNQGVWLTQESRVFPRDDTDMLQIRRDG
ncbi:beta-1,4-N-acetylgalactosaminyltransferase 3-like [Oculina patagonica]